MGAKLCFKKLAPDEFVKKVAQNEASPFLSKLLHELHRGK
jgi:hypothetical protein